MKKLYIIALAASLLVAAQAGAQNKNYDVLYNDPENARPFKLNVLPFFADLGPLNMSLGPALQAQWRAAQFLSIEGQVRYGLYLNLFNKRQEKDAKSANSLLTYRYAEGGVMLHFYDRIMERKLIMDFDENGITTSAKIQAKSRKFYAAHLGGFYTATPVGGGRDLILAGNDGHNYQKGGYYANFEQGGFYAGIATGRIDRMGISSSKRGKSNRRRDNVYFADFLYGLGKIEVTQIKDTATSKKDIVSKPATGQNTLGWRIGGQFIDNNKYIRIELGQRPGLKVKVTEIPINYIHFSIGVTLLGREKAASAQ
jgi:hypothetical protein